MKLMLTIQMDNAAFADDGNGGRDESSRILEIVRQKLEQGSETKAGLYDINGNRVGQWEIKPDAKRHDNRPALADWNRRHPAST
jgi:hypothetical protein